jgi:FMN-dependent dehydrogenase
MTMTRRDLMGRALALAASPLFAPMRALGQADEPLITSADQAADVFDFERVARANLPPAHFGYLATGVDGDATLHANAAGFEHYGLRVRRGQAGVEKVLDILKNELTIAMRQAGTRSISEINRSYIVDNRMA